MHACMHALYCIALHCIALHYITFYYITLHTYIHTYIYTYTYNVGRQLVSWYPIGILFPKSIQYPDIFLGWYSIENRLRGAHTNKLIRAASLDWNGSPHFVAVGWLGVPWPTAETSIQWMVSGKKNHPESFRFHRTFDGFKTNPLMHRWWGFAPAAAHHWCPGLTLGTWLLWEPPERCAGGRPRPATRW